MKKRLQIAVETGLAREIHVAARQRRMSISAWLVDAAKAQLRSEALRQFLDEWERNGPITQEELERARAELWSATSRVNRVDSVAPRRSC